MRRTRTIKMDGWVTEKPVETLMASEVAPFRY